MKQPHLYPEKNDFCFALLIAAAFAVTVAAAVIGGRELAPGPVGADYAKTQGARIALRGADKPVPQVQGAGDRR